MLGFGRHKRRLDELRGRFDRSPSRPSSSLAEAETRLSRVIDRHLTRQAAATAEADRLTRAFDLIPQGIVLADAGGHVVFRNRAASGFVDARHGEALIESAIDDLLSAAITGRDDTRTLELFGPPRRAVELRAGPLRADPVGAVGGGDGPVAGAFLIVEDVSARQRLEAVRRDFVANISHELKTPVGALGLLAETLVDEDDPAVIARLAERMQREAFRVAGTIDDLLQLSQIEVHALSAAEAVGALHVVQEAVDRTRPAAGLRDVEIAFGPLDEHAGVVGDRRQLVSAIANLCDNAVKYSDPGGRVTVSITSDDRHVAIEVADEGIGIPSRDLSRIFERFFRVDRARSRGTGGTGLGLSIVRHVVQNHDGEISVVSREGEGSTFTLRLPAVSGGLTEPRSTP